MQRCLIKTETSWDAHLEAVLIHIDFGDKFFPVIRLQKALLPPFITLNFTVC